LNDIPKIIRNVKFFYDSRLFGTAPENYQFKIIKFEYF